MRTYLGRVGASYRLCTQCGAYIAWVAGSDLYLDSSASYRVAQQVAGVERLTVSEQTLRHRLHEHGLLASIDTGRQTLQVRKTLERCPRHVLHLKASDLVGTIPETDEEAHPCGEGLLGWTQKELARRAGVGLGAVRRMEEAEGTVSTRTDTLLSLGWHWKRAALSS